MPVNDLIHPKTPNTSNLLTREDILASLPRIVTTLAEGAAERDLAGRLPFELVDYLRTTGVTWLRVPKNLGGPGGKISDQIEVTAALASGDSGLAHALRGHFGFVESIAIDPEGESARQYASEVLAGKLFGGAGMEIGTPRPNMIRTLLKKEGDHYRLNGHKYYSTGAIFSDFLSFSAIDEEGQPTGVMIKGRREGVSVNDDWDGMGQRLSASGSVDLDNVYIHASEVNPRGRYGMFGQQAPGTGAIPGATRRPGAVRAQLHLYAVMAGIVRNVLRDAIEYVQNQARSAKHSASETARGDHFVQSVVGEIAAASHTIDVLVAETARHLDASVEAILNNDPNANDIVFQTQLANSKGQIMIAKLALKAAEQLFDTGGGSAISRKRNFDRHWRNIRTLANHNPGFLRARVLGDYYLNETRTDFDEGRVF
ncbi:MAG: Acyl-CoA dehydrogenase type 2 domain [Sphingomonadales bacterium]|nr:Acyl-CoA dehydrogenase type 2 domain [Sphingomonadales bacterium]